METPSRHCRSHVSVTSFSSRQECVLENSSGPGFSLSDAYSPVSDSDVSRINSVGLFVSRLDYGSSRLDELFSEEFNLQIVLLDKQDPISAITKHI